MKRPFTNQYDTDGNGAKNFQPSGSFEREGDVYGEHFSVDNKYS